MIDEDIDNVKFLIRDLKAMSYNETFINSTKNVLSEVKDYQNHKKYHCEQLEKVLSEIESYKNRENKELETYKKIAERYERECRMFRAFCRRIRKDEKRDVDEFNQGREYAYIQFLNLISGEQNWEHEGKYFDEVDKELLDWARKEVEKDEI